MYKTFLVSIEMVKYSATKYFSLITFNYMPNAHEEICFLQIVDVCYAAGCFSHLSNTSKISCLLDLIFLVIAIRTINVF